jgi:hypothetical protein
VHVDHDRNLQAKKKQASVVRVSAIRNREKHVTVEAAGTESVATRRANRRTAIAVAVVTTAVAVTTAAVAATTTAVAVGQAEDMVVAVALIAAAADTRVAPAAKVAAASNNPTAAKVSHAARHARARREPKTVASVEATMRPHRTLARRAKVGHHVDAEVQIAMHPLKASRVDARKAATNARAEAIAHKDSAAAFSKTAATAEVHHVVVPPQAVVLLQADVPLRAGADLRAGLAHRQAKVAGVRAVVALEALPVPQVHRSRERDADWANATAAQARMPLATPHARRAPAKTPPI